MATLESFDCKYCGATRYGTPVSVELGECERCGDLKLLISDIANEIGVRILSWRAEHAEQRPNGPDTK